MGKYYFGNFPNSANYNDNVPLGFWKWDDTDCNDEIDNDWDEDYDEDDDAPEKETPDEEKELLKNR